MATMKSVLRSIADGNSSRLCKLLGRKSPGLQPQDLVRPLLESVRLGQEKCVKDLLSAKADPNGALEDGKTPLYLLVEVGGAKPVILRHLLEAGADPNRRTGGQQWTPLHMAAKRGYQVCLKALITAGAWLESPDHQGNTPLMVAAHHGHVTVVRTLLQEGAEKQATNAAKETPLHIAARAGHTSCIVELLEHGAYPNARDRRGQTPLLLACKYQQPEATDILLSYKCEVNAQDTETGRTALHWAVDREDYDRVVELLAANAQADIRDATWQTPFMLALAKGSKTTMELLLHAGCQVDVTDSHFNTALHLAAKDGRADLICMLVEAGIHVDISGESGLTPLMLAAFGGHQEVVRLLLEYGAQPNRKDRYRASALVYALISSAEESLRHNIVKQLIRANCDLNTNCNLANMTRAMAIPLDENVEVEERLYRPIEIAFLRGQTVVFQMLLKAGADPHQFRCDQLDSAVNELRHYPSELKSQWYLLRILYKERTQVKSLKDICRRPVLQSIALKYIDTSLKEKITKLNISKELKLYLSYADLDEIEAQFKVKLREAKRRSGPGRLENIMEEPNKDHNLKRRSFAAFSRDSLDYNQPSLAGSSAHGGHNESFTYGTFPLRRGHASRPRSAYEPGRLSSTTSTESLARSKSSRGSTESLNWGRSSVRGSTESLNRQPLTRSRSMRISSSSSSRSDVVSPPPTPLRRTGSLKFVNVQARTDSGLRPKSISSPPQSRTDSGLHSSTSSSVTSRQKLSTGSSLSSSPGNRSQGYGSRSSLSSVGSGNERSRSSSQANRSQLSSTGSPGSQQSLQRTGSMRITSPPPLHSETTSSLRRSSSLRLGPPAKSLRDRNASSPISMTSSRSSTPVGIKSPSRCLSPSGELSPIRLSSPVNNKPLPTRFPKRYMNGDVHLSNGNGSLDACVPATALKSILRPSTSSAFEEVVVSDPLNDTGSPLPGDDEVFSVSPPLSSALSSASEEVANLSNRMSPPHLVNGDRLSQSYDSAYHSRIPILSPKKEVQFNLDANRNEKKKRLGLTERIRNWRN